MAHPPPQGHYSQPPPASSSEVRSDYTLLRNKRGEEFVSPCMDDIKISSATFEEHVEEVNLLNKEARKDGFEFKLKKGQFNQKSIEFWGCILDGQGRRPQPKKVEQAGQSWRTVSRSIIPRRLAVFGASLKIKVKPSKHQRKQLLPLNP